MKTNLLKSIFISLILVMGVNNAWAYNYGGTNVYYYFANTGSWSNVYLYIWNNNNTWNTDFTLNKIANTNVYYHKWSSAYNDNGGILFRASTANWNNKTGDIKANYTSHTSWVHNNTTGSTDLSNINRQAKVVAMLSTGGNYTATANANCTATVSGYTVEKGKSTATSKSASTSGSADNASINAAYGSTITYTATAGTGYTFKGFSTSNSTSLPASPSASGKTATASGYGSTNNTTYYAYFKAHQYTIKFDANGGTTGSMSNQSHTYGVSKALTANAFTKTGYNFAGWNTKADGTGTKYTDKQSVSNLSSTDGATVTLYAQWTINSHKVTWKANGGNWGGNTADKVVTYNYGATIDEQTAPTRDGYDFKAWSPAFVANTTMPDNDLTYTAQWTAKEYTVTLDNQGATTAGQASVTATYNAAMPSIANNLPKKTDYTFNGYFDAASGGTQYYKADGTSARTWNKTANTTLYAQWTLNTYTVTWVVDKSTTTETVAHGSKVVKAPTIDPNNPPCGDKFVGWTTEFYAGKSEPATLYPTAADIPAVIGDVTYYAVFADYEN